MEFGLGGETMTWRKETRSEIIARLRRFGHNVPLDRTPGLKQAVDGTWLINDDVMTICRHCHSYRHKCKC